MVVCEAVVLISDWASNAQTHIHVGLTNSPWYVAWQGIIQLCAVYRLCLSLIAEASLCPSTPPWTLN